MARVFRAVSRRVPSSASRAVSPSGWIRNLDPARAGRIVECGGSMCADEDGVEDARHDANTEKADACKPHGPRRHDRGGSEVPRREIARHTPERPGEIEQVDSPAAGRKANRGGRPKPKNANPHGQ